MNGRKPPVGRSLTYHPAPGERDPRGSVLDAEDGYPATVSIARDDGLVQVIVLVEGDRDVGLRIARLVPLISDGEDAPAVSGYCTWGRT